MCTRDPAYWDFAFYKFRSDCRRETQPSQAGNPAFTNSASSQTSPHPWSGAPGLKRLVARSCLGLGLCLGPAVVGPGMESPWFLVDRVRGHAGAARIVYGPPDKIGSLRTWSPQMVWMSLTLRAFAAYEV